jgi:peptidoglycan/xylan/chitin deacetylase (PgdA/CDA1 family)
MKNANVAFRDLLRHCVKASNTLPLWQSYITRWPVVLSYHLVGDACPPSTKAIFTPHDLFISNLKSFQTNLRFLSFEEFMGIRDDPKASKHSVMLTFDDGFSKSWQAAREALSLLGIPSIFFVNTSTLDNARSSWSTQFNWLLDTGGVEALDPLWQLVSHGHRPHISVARQIALAHFSKECFLPAIEKSLNDRGFTSAGLAEHLNLFVSSDSLRLAPTQITIGNHSHNHYPMGRLLQADLYDEIVEAHRQISDITGVPPNVFAYPYGTPNDCYFDERGRKILSQLGSYQCIFSNVQSQNRSWEYGRIGLDGHSADCAMLALSNVRWKALLGA